MTCRGSSNILKEYSAGDLSCQPCGSFSRLVWPTGIFRAVALTGLHSWICIWRHLSVVDGGFVFGSRDEMLFKGRVVLCHMAVRRCLANSIR
jgi:hypothetical protein